MFCRNSIATIQYFAMKFCNFLLQFAEIQLLQFIAIARIDCKVLQLQQSILYLTISAILAEIVSLQRNPFGISYATLRASRVGEEVGSGGYVEEKRERRKKTHLKK